MKCLGSTRVRRLEAQRVAALFAALDREWTTFALHARGTSDRERAVFYEVLAPFAASDIEAFCAMVAARHTGGPTVRWNLPILAAVIGAFRRHNAGTW